MQDARIRRIKKDELVRVQGDPELVEPDPFPVDPRSPAKCSCQGTYRPGGIQTDDIWGDPEKEQEVFCIVRKNCSEAGEICLYGFFQPLIGI